MKHIFHMTEWESNGRWLCGDVSALALDSNDWTYPVQILSLTPVEYVKLLIFKYNATVYFYSHANLLIFYFSSLEDCRKFKNDINKKAREKNFFIY